MKEVLPIIYGIGIAQGVFLILALLSMKKTRGNPSTKLLVLLLFCPLTLIIHEFLWLIYPLEKIAVIFRIGETIPLVMSPLLFLYVSQYALILFSPSVTH